MEKISAEDTKVAASQPDKKAGSPVPDTEHSGGKVVAKKRTWRKPKDKPKRPLSAYNIFFRKLGTSFNFCRVTSYQFLTPCTTSEHARSRIVQGLTEEVKPEEIVSSIEGILSKSREKRRHRKSHGKISFGDLARAIAEQWKNIDPKHKEIFDHYAEVDMIRYRREVKIWKEKKEMESEASALAKHSSLIHQMSNSFSSAASSAEDYLDALPDESGDSDSRAMNGSFNSSYSSAGDSSMSGKRRMHSDNMSLMIQRQQQLLRQQLRGANSDFMATTLAGNNGQVQQNLPGSQAFHQSFSSTPSGFDFEPLPEVPQSQTMQQLKLQQEQQLEQMRQLQMKQQQIQQQMQMQRMQQRHLQQQQQQNFGMGNSSLTDGQGLSFVNQHQMANQTPLFGNPALDSSLNLGDALQSPSVHVSDYSSSTVGHGSGFASTRSFGMGSHSDGMNAGSFQHGDVQQQMNFMQARNNSFSGPFIGMHRQQQDDGPFNFLVNDDQQQHDLRGMMDMDT